METARAKLTVFFDPPFWAGLFERECGGQYAACKVVFGAEPREAEIYAYVLERYGGLDFSPAMEAERKAERAVNPKRARRMAREQTTGIGTKAQQALQLQREQNRAERRVLSRKARQAEEERRRLLRQAKRKEKHRGR